MPLSDEQIARLLAPKVRATKPTTPQAAGSKLSKDWHLHFHHRAKSKYRERTIGPLSYDFERQQECRLPGCLQPTYFEVDGEPRCSFHALTNLAHRLSNEVGGNGDSSSSTDTDYF